MRSYRFLLQDKNRHQTLATLFGLLDSTSRLLFEKELRRVSCLDLAHRLVGKKNPEYERLCLRTPALIWNATGQDNESFSYFIRAYFTYSVTYQNLPNYLYLLDPYWEMQTTSFKEIFGEAFFGSKTSKHPLFPLKNSTLESIYLRRFRTLTKRFCNSTRLETLGELTPEEVFYNTLWLDKTDFNVLCNCYHHYTK